MPGAKLIAGSLLIVAAEQAYAHTWLIGFPHHVHASEVLVPASVVLLTLGLGMLLWGIWTEIGEKKAAKAEASASQDTSAAGDS